MPIFYTSFNHSPILIQHAVDTHVSAKMEKDLTPLSPTVATKSHTQVEEMENAVPQNGTMEHDHKPEHGQ